MATFRETSDEELAVLLGGNANIYNAMSLREQCRMEDLLDTEVSSYTPKKLLAIYIRSQKRVSNMFRG